MIRITRKAESESQMTLYVEGRLVPTGVDELAREMQLLLAAGPKVVLDLGGVTWVGSHAVEIFVDMLDRSGLENVDIRASALLNDLLREDKTDDAR